VTGVAPFVVGGGIGLALALLVVVLRPAGPDLAAVTAQLDASTAQGKAHTPALEQRVGQRVVGAMTGLGRDYRRLEADLPMAGTTLAGVVGRSVIFAVVGAVFGAFVAAMAAGAGIGLTGTTAVGVVVGLALLCSRLPVMATRARAANRRASFIHALGALLDFLAIELAAGAGIKDALTRSLDKGGGWAFDLMRERVTVARDSGGREWEALEQLGVELAVDELVELGSSIALARTQGATARDTLIAKARSLRQRQVTTAEETARKATERAGAPIAIQLYAVLLAVIYVLITRLQTGLGA
jgi:tight adherence protein C